MARNRRDRERKTCETCGREVTVRRDGGLMAHTGTDGRACVIPAYAQRQQAERERLEAARAAAETNADNWWANR